MLHPSICVEFSSIHGRGLIARDIIPLGTVIWELDNNHTKYNEVELFQLPPEIRSLPYWVGTHYILVYDGSEYMNHSCDPNCWFQGDTTLIARRIILPSEEVTYDYATTEIDSILHQGLTCTCGTALCRGLLQTHDILMPELQELYAGHLPSWTVNFIRQQQLLTGF
jgi:SET domain-containing protein